MGQLLRARHMLTRSEAATSTRRHAPLPTAQIAILVSRSCQISSQGHPKSVAGHPLQSIQGVTTAVSFAMPDELPLRIGEPSSADALRSPSPVDGDQGAKGMRKSSGDAWGRVLLRHVFSKLKLKQAWVGDNFACNFTSAVALITGSMWIVENAVGIIHEARALLRDLGLGVFANSSVMSQVASSIDDTRRCMAQLR